MVACKRQTCPMVCERSDRDSKPYHMRECSSPAVLAILHMGATFGGSRARIRYIEDETSPKAIIFNSRVSKYDILLRHVSSEIASLSIARHRHTPEWLIKCSISLQCILSPDNINFLLHFPKISSYNTAVTPERWTTNPSGRCWASTATEHSVKKLQSA